MFVGLNELLGVTVEKPEQGKLTLLCAAKTDASFLVHHFLSFYLKAGCKVCFVAIVQSFSHYSLVAQKLGVSLTAAKERGQLVFLEGLKSSNNILFGEGQASDEVDPFQFISGDGSNLKDLYEYVQKALSPGAKDGAGVSWKPPVLVVDNLGVLLSLGVSLTDILDFIHYCRVGVNSQLKLTIIQRSSWETRAERDLSCVYQYKIQDKNVLFFARGMSAAVL